MKKNYLIIVLPIIMGMLFFASCEKSDSESGDETFNKLLGTWKLTHYTDYDNEGNVTNDFDSQVGTSYYTFTYQTYENDPSEYLCISDYISLSNNVSSYKWYWTYSNNYIGGTMVSGEVISVNGSQLLLKKEFYDGNGYQVTTYVKASEPEHVFNSGGGTSGGDTGEGGGGTSGGDAPYITSFNSTSTKTSITVKFMCSERPTSATIKYGTSSASITASSSIAGKQVSATVSGLKAGTKYYFKCTVKNQYGSSTSDEYPAMTNY